ncbi:MAG TPA: hypothetical protein PLM36_06015, partial [Leptospiraceae bacterium]|nr:hypothetical protein [Leptospiraceae bacterium]HMW06945.1 hypothetical protein [Leptospiraceae bacterium]HMY30587.1 hypothetical protein [Leptospiraceae bacterium]HNF57817.1 hypothetical protein [Leptospiraceae bacterium]
KEREGGDCSKLPRAGVEPISERPKEAKMGFHEQSERKEKGEIARNYLGRGSNPHEIALTGF